MVGLCQQYGVNRGTLLEVGPGFGTFAAVAQESGAFARVVAVEPTPELARACRERGVHVLEKRIEDVADEFGQVEVVACFEVIEHLFAPLDFVRQCARLLVPGGLLVLTCPNGLGFDVTTLGAQSPAVGVEHCNLFNPKALGILVEQAGLAVLESSTPGRLDAELVRNAVLAGRYDLTGQSFLRRILLDEWDRLGWPFQQFLAQNGLSSHMWLAARRTA